MFGICRLKKLFQNEREKELKGGGPSIFFASRFMTSNLRYTPILH